MNKNIIFISLLLLTSCTLLKSSKKINNKQKLKVLKKELSLTQVEYKALKNDDSIINEAYKTLKDTVDIAKINKRLDSFFAKKYTRKATCVSLILERANKGLAFDFEFTGEVDKNDTTTYNPNIEKELKKLFNSYENSIIDAGFEMITDTSITNSIHNNDSDSLHLIKLKKYIRKKDSLKKISKKDSL
ncbi:hypothetical protein [Pontimicrobium sp. MEBiC01747]